MQTEINAKGELFYVYDKKGNLYAIPASTKTKNSTRPSFKLTLKKSELDHFKFESSHVWLPHLFKILVAPPPNTPEKPESEILKKKKKTKTLADITLSLGFPVGITLGSFGIQDEQFPEK